MNNNKTYKLLAGIAMILCFVLLVPSAVKFLHIFENHQHETCLGEHTTHLHKIDKDCEFYKFKVNQPFTFSNTNYTEVKKDLKTQKIFFNYNFSNSHQPLYFSLRAPPNNCV